MARKIRLIILCLLTQVNICFCSDITFNEFIAKFPLCEWAKLDSIKKITLKDVENKKDTLSFEDANEHIWEHGVKQPHEEWRGSIMPSPHIRMGNNTYRSYMGGYLGVFDCEYGIRYNKKTDEWESNPNEKSQLFPLGRVELKDIVLLIVGYKFRKEMTFDFSIDVYILCKSSKNFISAFCLSGSNPVFTILYNDYRITSYERYDTIDDVITNRYVYKIESDGYLTEISADKNISDFSWKTVVDSDGYVNVRNYPNVKSEILYRIPSQTEVLSYQLKGTDWVEIVDVKSSKRIGGYVHNSRLK